MSARTARLPRLLLLALCLPACAHAPARPGRVAIAPVDTLGVAGAEGATLHDALCRDLRKEGPGRVACLEVLPPLDGPGSCAGSAACLARVGREAAAELVLSLTLAGLGDLRLVHARLVRSRDEMVLRDLQETTAAGHGHLERYAAGLRGRLLPARSAPRWYRRWWLWPAVAAVVGTTVGVSWWAASRSGQQQDPNLVHLGRL